MALKGGDVAVRGQALASGRACIAHTIETRSTAGAVGGGDALKTTTVGVVDERIVTGAIPGGEVADWIAGILRTVR